MKYLYSRAKNINNYRTNLSIDFFDILKVNFFFSVLNLGLKAVVYNAMIIKAENEINRSSLSSS